MIEIDVAAAGMFHRARGGSSAEVAVAAVVWWGDNEEKVVVMKDLEVGRFGDWMREWEAMVRWCGGGWWRRSLLIELLFLLPQATERWRAKWRKG